MFFRKIILIIFLFSGLFFPQQSPKLVVGIVIDQMRFDYLYRFRNNYGEDGFKRLMNEGANFTNSHFNYAPTITGPGHASIYTGTTPFYHGIIGNDFYNRDSGKRVYCVNDFKYSGVGGEEHMAPTNLMCTTITDQLKLSNNGMSKVIAIAIKDRGAILPGGKLANAAFWYNSANGNFMSSTYYMEKLPDWVIEFNSKKLPAKYSSMEWTLSTPIENYISSFPDENNYEPDVFKEGRTSFPHSLKNILEKDKLEYLKSTPFGNQLTVDFASDVIDNEKLGKNIVPDFLTISFSSTDYIGHRYGPNSVEIQDTYIKLDGQIAQLLKMLDDKVGKGNYVLFLTADHGVSEMPSYINIKDKNIFFNNKFTKSVKQFLNSSFGSDKLFAAYSDKQIFLDHKLMLEMKLDGKKVRSELSEYIRTNFPEILLVVTSDLFDGKTASRNEPNLLLNGYNPIRSGDIIVELRADYFLDLGGNDRVTHGTIYSYDTHVPLLFYGWGIPKLEINDPVFTVDIAATIANLLKITEPSASIGIPLIKSVIH